MWQQILALIIIIFFVIRLFGQRRKDSISKNELVLWLFFWLIAGLAIIFIKQIDSLVHSLGFSASGINFLIYLAVIILFYLLFRLRLKVAKLENNLSLVVREVAQREVAERKNPKN
ncbi:MAG: DUF2304 domain-containing protein [Candidatus Falkowbacteria bacterium]|nr:DUF2304 domain-containing protein [Candidatus Falkowbacteria bacterium]